MVLSQREKLLIKFALIFITMALYYVYIYEPMVIEITNIVEEISINEERLKEIIALADIKNNIEEKARDFKELYNKIILSIPPGGDIPQFLIEIEELTENMIQVQRHLVTQDITYKEGYFIQSVDISLSGADQSKTLEFINKLENMDRLVTIRELTYSVHHREYNTEHNLTLKLDIYGLLDE